MIFCVSEKSEDVQPKRAQHRYHETLQNNTALYFSTASAKYVVDMQYEIERCLPEATEMPITEFLHHITLGKHHRDSRGLLFANLLSVNCEFLVITIGDGCLDLVQVYQDFLRENLHALAKDFVAYV